MTTVLELKARAATGQTVVYSAVVKVTTWIYCDLAGQSTAAAKHLVIVFVIVSYTVEVVNSGLKACIVEGKEMMALEVGLKSLRYNRVMLIEEIAEFLA
jgi:hypothetical protein